MSNQIEQLQQAIQEAQNKINSNDKKLQELRNEVSKENEELRTLIKRKNLLLSILKESQLDGKFLTEAINVLEQHE